MTLQNLLFCAHTLCMNYVTNTFLMVSSSVRSKQLLCFVQGQDLKRRTKTYNKELCRVSYDLNERMHFFHHFNYQELFESLEEKFEEDLIEALAALSLSKAMYDARTLDQAMRVSR